MCLATAYKSVNDENLLVCKNVTRILVEGSIIKLENIMGESVEVEGSLKFIDLMENKVIIEAAE